MGVRFLVKVLNFNAVRRFSSNPIWNYSIGQNIKPGFIIVRNMASELNPPSTVRDKMGIRTAGIIIIGDEILNGDVKDENTHFLCRRFHTLGVRVVKVSVVSDTLSAIAEEVKKFSDKYDIVVTSGGIGPTHDDVTYEGIAKAFNEELVTNEELKTFWELFYTHNDKLGKDNPAIKMSKIPKSGRLINTERCKIRDNVYFPFVVISNIYVFPGIPTYLRKGFSALEDEHFSGGSNKFYDRTIMLSVHESEAIYALNKTSKEYEKTVKIGSYPIVDNPAFKTKLTLESSDEDQVDKAYTSLVSLLNPEWIKETISESQVKSPKRIEDLITTENENFHQLFLKSIKDVAKCFNEYNMKDVFLCFNGGKDCTALLYLVHYYLMDKIKTDEKLQVLYIRCKDSFQETEDFITETAQRYNLDMTVVDGPLKPSLEKLMKGEKSHWKAVLMGTRRTDPNSGKLDVFQETDPGWPKLMRVSPFLDWSYQDIWNFIKQLDIPYCSLYDKGYTSLGSRYNTKPNPDLAYEENGVTKYKPAYTLANPNSERNGRC